jgi:hypothetical protein
MSGIKRILLVLFGMENRTFGPYSAAINRILIPLMYRSFELATGGGPSLASMFAPPRDIMFNGTFEDAKAAALGQRRWLVRAG